MANIPFKSITFPGLPNKYTVPEISTDLTTSGKAADAKAVGDELSEIKADLGDLDSNVHNVVSLKETVPISYIKENDGKYIKFNTGELITSTPYRTTNYVNITDLGKITYSKIKVTAASATTIGMAFYDANKEYVDGIRALYKQAEAGYEDSTVEVPSNAVYARFTLFKDEETYGEFSLSGESKLYNKFAVVESDMRTNATALSSYAENTDAFLSLEDNIAIAHTTAGSGYGIRFSTGELLNNTTLSYTDYINVAKYDNVTYKRIVSTLGTPTYGMAFYNKNKVYISGERCFAGEETAGYRESTISVPENAVYARFSVYKDTETYGEFALSGESKLHNRTKISISPFKKNVKFGSFSSEWYKGQEDDYSFYNINTLYSEMITRWDALLADSKGYMTKETIGTSSDNQTMYVYKLIPLRYRNNTGGTFANNAPIFLIVPSIHGFEKSAAFGTYYFARDLIYNFDKNPVLNSIRTKAILYIVPVGNPYGFDNKIRKNANGVDLNRNWGVDPDGITDTTSQYYPGAEPFDQPETQAIKGVIDNTENLFFIIDYHTNGQYKAASWADVNWMTYAYAVRYDDYYLNVYTASQFQISEITENIQIEYNVNTGGESIGSITWGAESAPRPTIAYYCRTAKNIMGLTFEGNNGLPSEESSYSAIEQKVNSELIGNWIKNLFLAFKDA